jgi:hypothetical protein
MALLRLILPLNYHKSKLLTNNQVTEHFLKRKLIVSRVFIIFVDFKRNPFCKGYLAYFTRLIIEKYTI